MYGNRSFVTKKPEQTIVEASDVPGDTISDIAVNFENTHVAVSSWDSTIKIYKISAPAMSYLPSTTSSPTLVCEKTFTVGKPCLSVCFFGSFIVGGLVDGSLVVFDLSGNQNSIPSAHAAPIKSIKNFANQFIITGSFDSTLKFWDLKSTNSAHTITVPGKVYGMDLRGSFLCVLLSDKSVQTYDLTNITLTSTINTRFNYSVRSVACGTDSDSFAVGGIEAKVEVFFKSSESKKFIFRSHREGNKLYSVNVIRFDPTNPNIIVTGGADKSIVFFDKSNRMKIHTSTHESPITAAEFTNDGKYFIFAVGDDWSKGYTGIPSKTALKLLDAKAVAQN